MSRLKVFIIVAALFLVPLLYVFINYGSLPDEIATHFTSDGEADGYSSKQILYFIVLAVFLLTEVIIVLSTIFYKESIPLKFIFSISLILTFICLFVVYTIIGVANGKDIDFARSTIIMVGVVFIVLGNYLNKLKPNPIAGFRFRITLNNGEIWRKVHRLGGWLYCISGAILILLSSYLSIEYMIAFIVVSSVVPIMYAYKLEYDLGKEKYE